MSTLRDGAVGGEGAAPVETEESAEPQTPEVEPEAEAEAPVVLSYEESHKPFHVEMMDSMDKLIAMERYEDEGIEPDSVLGFIKDVSVLGMGVFIPEDAREPFCIKLIRLNVHYLGRYGEGMPMLSANLVRFLRDQLGDEAVESLLSGIGMVWFDCTCGRCGNKVVVPEHIGQEGFVTWKREQLRQQLAERTGLDIRELGADSLLDEQGQPITPEGAFAAMILTPDGGMMTTDARGIARLMTANAEGPEKLQEVAAAMVAEGVATLAKEDVAEAPAEAVAEVPTEEGAPAAEAVEEPAEQ